MNDPTADGSLPLFERATRRALLRRGLAATGALTAAALLAACGNDDSSAFASTSTAGATTTPAAPSSRSATTTPRSSSAGTATTGTATSGTTGTATTGKGVGVAFDYSATADAGGGPGRVRNPYVAVWVEDGSGELAGLLGVWYSTREAKYLRELTEFTAATTGVEQTSVDAVAGATRSAGAYELQWDGAGVDGTPLDGEYTLWIEAAREHGPHSVTSGPVTLGRAGTATIPGNGELSDATVTVA